ncbi:NO-inducible flavohemoprotein [Halobacteriovorax sp.]|uniref:NO-inducible flavohemoprotein n=1 Tax=Halobacteriovorax sp. TaxID=2020862 RepID=UPI003567C790
MINQKSIDIVKSTAPVLEENGVLLTKYFYKRMFENNPEVLPFFNKANQEKGVQQDALAGAICAYAKNIDNLDALSSAVQLISHKHFSLKIKPEHYPIVGENLLESIKDVLGDAATPDLIDAWSEAYFFLADIFINAEKSLEEESIKNFNGYSGFKKFEVVQKIKESEVITSFILKPKDGRLPIFKAGQYITVRVPSDETTTMRNYSLSAYGSSDSYRISVKKESKPNELIHEGYVSNFLHRNIKVGDFLDVGCPAGVFTLEEKSKKREVVFLAGGVGITPLLSMIHASLGEGSSFESIKLFHANKSEATQAFKSEIGHLELAHKNFKSTFIYETLQRETKSNEFLGFISEDILKDSINIENSTFYICGPKNFMSAVIRILRNIGIEEESIKFEFFGPLETL